MELIADGNLFEYIEKKFVIKEDEARFDFFQLLCGLQVNDLSKHL